jgi:Aldo/keto reductase family
MDEIELIGTGKRTSRVGLGCGSLVGGVSKRASMKFVEAAVDLGIRHFDVAPSYGLGLAESVLGEVLNSRWNRLTVTTKVGIMRPPAPRAMATARKIVRPLARVIPGLKGMMLRTMRSTSVSGRFSKDDIETSFADSRRILRTNCVDILMLHEPRLEDITPEVSDIFAQLIEQGEAKLAGSGTGETFEKLVKFGTVSQYRWDPMTHGTQSAGELHIQHGALRYGLATLPSAITARPKQTQDLSALLGLDLTDRSNHPAMLATIALAADPQSILLVSSKDIYRLRSCVKGINWSVARGGNPGVDGAIQSLLCAPVGRSAN